MQSSDLHHNFRSLNQSLPRSNHRVCADWKFLSKFKLSQNTSTHPATLKHFWSQLQQCLYMVIITVKEATLLSSKPVLSLSKTTRRLKESKIWDLCSEKNLNTLMNPDDRKTHHVKKIVVQILDCPHTLSGSTRDSWRILRESIWNLWIAHLLLAYQTEGGAELFARARPRSTQRGRSYLQMGRTSQLNHAEATPSRDVQDWSLSTFSRSLRSLSQILSTYLLASGSSDSDNQDHCCCVLATTAMAGLLWNNFRSQIPTANETGSRC